MTHIETDKVLADYKAAVLLLYGPEIAEKSRLYYSHGWYYINLARRYPDGSAGAIGEAFPHRRQQVEVMTRALLQRCIKERGEQ